MSQTNISVNYEGIEVVENNDIVDNFDNANDTMSLIFENESDC